MTAAGEHLRPSFFIVGERKCGTSSLYRYLIAHPHVLPGRRKEPDYFGAHPPEYVAAHLEDEYLAQFPRRSGAGPETLLWPELDDRGALYEEPIRFERVPGRAYVTGEASANTFFDVDPRLVRRHLPEVKLLVVVRDPVERAFSHHRMYERFQAEGRELGFAVGAFADDMRAELAAVRRGERTPCVSPGIYIDRLRRWVEVWGWSQLRVLRCEDLDEPAARRAVVADVTTYLGLPPFEDEALDRRFNRAPPAAMAPDIRSELSAFYRPYNRALEAYLGRAMGWDD